MRWRFYIFLGFFTSLTAQVYGSSDFQSQIAPILEKYCYQCHGETKQKGDIRFDSLSTDFQKNRRAAEVWHDALHSVQLGEMPPEDESQPTSSERKLLTEWIEKSLHAAATLHSPNKTNSIVIRRLNRTEYAYTMEDLLGFKMNYTQYLPADSLSTDGFLWNSHSSRNIFFSFSCSSSSNSIRVNISFPWIISSPPQIILSVSWTCYCTSLANG